MNVGSLFSGIGGIDLGLERAGMTVRWQSEIDPYCCRVLHKHWPDVPNLGDVTAIDWSAVEPVDVIAGGYPCQPFSLAGARGGEADARHLWPRFRDAIRHLRPRYALLENVPGHLSLGFGRVLGDLAELGYDCEWDCIPAAAVGAPHLRYRVFVVAYPNIHEHESSTSANGWPTTANVSAHANGYGKPERPVDALAGSGFVVPDAEGLTVGTGLRTGEPGRQRRRRPGDSGSTLADTDVAGSQGRLQRVRSTDQRITGPGCQPDAEHWLVEPDVGRVAHGVPHRVDRLRALGNAVVPQVAEWIGRRIMAAAV